MTDKQVALSPPPIDASITLLRLSWPAAPCLSSSQTAITNHLTSDWSLAAQIIPSPASRVAVSREAAFGRLANGAAVRVSRLPPSRLSRPLRRWPLLLSPQANMSDDPRAGALRRVLVRTAPPDPWPSVPADRAARASVRSRGPASRVRWRPAACRARTPRFGFRLACPGRTRRGGWCRGCAGCGIRARSS